MGVRIGIVGAGMMGETHAVRYESLPQTDVVAVADVDAESASELADRNGAEAYEDHGELLANEAVDAVSVWVHNADHAPIAIDALEAGADVFCEKPMADSYAAARRMYDAARAGDRHLAIQNSSLYSPTVRAAKQFVDAGHLGTLYHGVVTRYSGSAGTPRRGRPYINGYGSPAFLRRETAGGGPVYDLGTYAVGKLLYLFDNPRVERVKGRTFAHRDDTFSDPILGSNAERYRERRDRADPDVEDVGIGMADLADGSSVFLRTAYAMEIDPLVPDHIVGTTGGLRLDPFEYYTTVADVGLSADGDIESHAWRERQFAEPAVPNELQNHALTQFVLAITGERTPLPTAEIALNGMAFLEGIYLSAAAGRELSREEIERRSEAAADGTDHGASRDT